MMMGYFREPRRKEEREVHGESVRAALLVVDGEAAEEEYAVPKGYFAVYVGAEARRFVVPTAYLCQPAFRELMERAAEEFGFGQAGGLHLPCREEDFETTVTELEAASAGRRRRRPAGRRNSMVKARSL
ncbi:hypothetical protein ABZP36_022474 [Zizania latifolia]